MTNGATTNASQSVLSRDGVRCAGRCVSRRLFVVVLAALCALLSLAFSARSSYATEDAGHLTVVGVVGIDPSTTFSSFAEVVAAVASCDPVSQLDDPSGAAIVVHGTVHVDASQPGGVFDLWYPVDGAAYAVVGADPSSKLVVSGGELFLSNSGGSFVLHGLTVSGNLRLFSRDDVVIDSCTFNGAISCETTASVNVTGNVFETIHVGSSTALTAGLTGTTGTLSFVGNVVSGYTCCVAAWCSAEANSVSVYVSSNQIDLVRPDDPAWTGTVAAIRLDGGPWSAASLVRDGNTLTGADALLVLGASFSIAVSTPEGAWVESIEGATLSANAIMSLFELVGSGTSTLPEGITAVVVDGANVDPYVVEQVSLASAAVLSSGQAVPESRVQYTLLYDPNGATAGVGPDAVVLEAGSSVSVANMGSLVAPGCVFQGWNTASDGSGTFYAVGQVFSLQGNVTLYAQWASTGTVATVDVASGAPSEADGQ